MDLLLRPLFIVLGFTICCLVGPVVALFFLRRRKRLERARRRSPLVADLLRGPGHSLLDQIIEAENEFGWDAMLLMVVPLACLCAALTQVVVTGGVSWPIVGVLVVFGLLHSAYTTRRLMVAAGQMDDLRVGYDGEVAVGQELDRLMRQGAYVYHDVPADHFNIDHVVASSQGVFAVETKGFRKPAEGGAAAARVSYSGSVLTFPDWKTSEPIEQAARQASWLAKWLGSATGESVAVMPVVALPGWFVERKGQGTVRVFAGGELPYLLRSRGTAPLNAQQLQRVTHQLEQRVRTVAPRYRDDEVRQEPRGSRRA